VSKARWQLWREQVLGVIRLDLKRNFALRRALWIYLLALAPAVIFEIGALKNPPQFRSAGMDTHIFAVVFQVFYLRFVVFFGCAGVFLNLFHGEVLDKSLHFYFLAPLPREVLLAGKYLTGLAAASAIFCLSVVLQFAALYGSSSGGLGQFLFQAHGWEQLAGYLGVTVLACAGYGSVFLFLGVLFRNALVPSIAVLVWEIVSGYLPPLLQKLSVIYYLKSLCPVQVAMTSLAGNSPLSLFTFNPEPALAPTAILSLLILIGVLLAAASLRLRRMEIDYAAE
jgi:ABC-type transport system involved in multi-copper enzyme maturation permease subunit